MQNLRRIWEKYRQEHKITQVEAGKSLGMTQSGFSHYIANITVLNPSAIIKLAAFLEVHPAEIDPEWNKEIPDSFRLMTVNSKKQIKVSPAAFTAHNHTYEYNEDMKYPLPKGCSFVAVPPSKIVHKHTDLWFVRENKDSNWIIIEQAQQPSKKDGWGAVKGITHIFT